MLSAEFLEETVQSRGRGRAGGGESNHGFHSTSRFRRSGGAGTIPGAERRGGPIAGLEKYRSKVKTSDGA